MWQWARKKKLKQALLAQSYNNYGIANAWRLYVVEKVTCIAAKLLTDLGGGKHGYLKLLYDDVEYIKFLHNGMSFIQHMHQGTYQANSPTYEGNWCCAKAHHKAQLEMHFKYLQFKGSLKWLVLNVMNKVLVTRLEDDKLGFMNSSTLELFKHLENQGGALDFVDQKSL